MLKAPPLLTAQISTIRDGRKVEVDQKESARKTEGKQTKAEGKRKKRGRKLKRCGRIRKEQGKQRKSIGRNKSGTEQIEGKAKQNGACGRKWKQNTTCGRTVKRTNADGNQ